ncbi:beta family protein [Geminicoccus harenae]|uniref:beta family protein n=1 Tax=Geminicoccus harenae TaxID=2498453 RepID=UPI00168AB9D5
MVHRYVPILRWKRGERVGMRRLSVGGRRDVLPLFVCGADRFVGRKATKTRAAIQPADAFADELRSTWGIDPVSLDASAVAHGSASHHPIIDIGSAARAQGLTFIPATRLDAPLLYQQGVSAVAATDKRGVVLRVDLQQFTSASAWIGAWPHAPGDTDLVVDFTNNVVTVASLGSTLDAAFQTLHRAGDWRSVTMTGTSMPENFSGFAAGLHTISRSELRLWQRLSSLALPYRLDYGDYATVPTVPPPSGIAWGFPINAKYPLSDNFVVCRGVSTTGLGSVDMDVQLRGHAQSIRAYPVRGSLAHCWADQQIDAIAAGSTEPGNLETWVQLGINRHVEVTRATVP